jgi:hypothetical protein
VSETWCQWKSGQVLVFDDSFEHEVRNDSDQCRAVLLLRFWHPDLPEQEREHALEQALQSKEDDRLQRYNSPLPDPDKRVEDRGMERTRCSQCWRTGFETIRVVDSNKRVFVCSCGQPIC